MYIAQQQCPNFRVLSDFRKVNAMYFRDCFKQTVQLALTLNLASLGHISMDGSKFKASSSKHKAMTYQRLQKKELGLMAEIDILIGKANLCDEEEDRRYQDETGYKIPEDLKFKKDRLEKIKAAKQALENREETLHPGKKIEGRKQISFADKDARMMGKKGNFDYRYNAQISVDEDNQIIVGQHVSQNSNDTQEVKPALDSIMTTTGQLPDKMTLDNGYMSGDNLETLEAAKVDSYVATDRTEKSGGSAVDESTRRLVKADFEYNESEDIFICPAGQKLRRIKTTVRELVYQGKSDICDQCRYKSRCCQSSKGKARTITADHKEGIRRRMNLKMERTESKELYKKRKHIVEPTIGQIKNSGFTGFSVRSIGKVRGEFSLVCTVHNVKKIIKAITTGRITRIYQDGSFAV
jgi:hypothetical protein